MMPRLSNAKNPSTVFVWIGPLAYSSDAMTEIGAYFRKSGRVIIPLTVKEILDEQIAHKLA